MTDLSRNEMSEPLHGKLLTSALSAATQVSHRYPIDLLQTVETQVEQTFAAKGRKALLTKGVDDAIDSVLRLHSQATPFVFRPTFSGFFERFRALGIPFESIALDHRHEPPTLGITSPVSGKFFFLANPNNPTGTVWPSELIIEAAQQAEHIFSTKHISTSPEKEPLRLSHHRTHYYFGRSQKPVVSPALDSAS